MKFNGANVDTTMEACGTFATSLVTNPKVTIDTVVDGFASTATLPCWLANPNEAPSYRRARSPSAAFVTISSTRRCAVSALAALITHQSITLRALGGRRSMPISPRELRSRVARAPVVRSDPPRVKYRPPPIRLGGVDDSLSGVGHQICCDHVVGSLAIEALSRHSLAFVA